MTCGVYTPLALPLLHDYQDTVYDPPGSVDFPDTSKPGC